MTFLRKLGWLLNRRKKEDDLHDELAFHLEEEAEERGGAAAKRDLGNLALIQEDMRAAWSWIWLEQFFQDVRYAARTMLSNKAFSALAVLSLALGIGANTAIYSFLDALLLRSLPVADPESLVVLNWHIVSKDGTDGTVAHHASGNFHQEPDRGTTTGIFPYPAFELLRASNQVCSSLFAYHPTARLNLFLRGQAEAARGTYVSGDFFGGLGVIPAAGRLIDNNDDRAGAQSVVVLSYAFAQKYFGDPLSAAGQPVAINNLPFTAIGVAPQGFAGVDPRRSPDFFLPLHADLALEPDYERTSHPPRYADGNYYWMEMMGRLRPGVTRAQAEAALGAQFQSWVAGTARTDSERANLPQLFTKEGRGGVDDLRREASPEFFFLLGIVGLILAIACANIASLLLARAAARKREMAVRLSMGAGRWRVIRQLLTESVWLASIGGLLGILFATWGIQLLKTIFGSETVALNTELNWRVLIAAAALTIVTGVLFGLAPALQATRVDVLPALKEARGAAKETRQRLPFNLGQILVVAQITLSLLLLIVAGLFVRTLSNFNSLDLGFRRENTVLFSLNAEQAGHRDPEIISFYNDLTKRLAAIPGVHAAAIANSPLIGAGAWGWAVVPAGTPKPDAPTGHGSGISREATRTLATGPGFFSAMQIPLIAGREFDERDKSGSAPVVIVNEAWAKVNLQNRNPVGQQVTSFGIDGKPVAMEIVGLVKNTRYDDLTGAFPAIVYLPFAQNHAPIAQMTYFLRTAGDPASYSHSIREIVQQADARIPVTNIVTQTAQINDEISDQILFARLCSGFALLALAIACVGLYGTMSYSVARRTGEIGIRMALGAKRIQVVWMVMRQVMVMAAIGLAIGLPAAVASSKILESLFYGIKAQDLIAVGAAVAAVVMVVIGAGYLPAQRASRIDPMIALRHE